MSLNVKPAFGEEGSATGEIFETKFVVPRAIAEILKSTISRNAVKPPRFHSARLKTTYFDDASGTSFFESRDGHLSKKKYRLRTYMDPDPEGALYSIEVKRRSDARTGKVKRLIYKPLPPGYAPTTFRDLIATSDPARISPDWTHTQRPPRTTRSAGCRPMATSTRVRLIFA